MRPCWCAQAFRLPFSRKSRMRQRSVLSRLGTIGTFGVIAASLSCAASFSSNPSDPFPAVHLPGKAPAYELRNGHWFTGSGFEGGTMYSVYGVLTERRPEPVDSVIDLQGGYVVPAFG